MRGNHFGKMFSFMSFGESHGEAMGVVIDGMPSNVKVNLESLKKELARRAPGQSGITTSRKESDAPEILSGVYEGVTLGTPIAVVVRNTNQRSEDYKDMPDRPGHADKTTQDKFGVRDPRGGGRASGRETVARVIAGWFAGIALPSVDAYAWSHQIGSIRLSKDPEHGKTRAVTGVPDDKISQEVETFLLTCKSQGESAGGIVGLSIKGVPTGLGEPAFDKLKSDLGKAMLSIGGCMGFEIGAGFNSPNMTGTALSTERRNFGGLEGGITNGEAILLKIVFKAPSTVGDKAKAGRHDPCLLPRVLPVVEAMAKAVILDHHLRQKAYS